MVLANSIYKERGDLHPILGPLCTLCTLANYNVAVTMLPALATLQLPALATLQRCSYHITCTCNSTTVQLPCYTCSLIWLVRTM